MDNWVELLPEAEIALSKRESATTKQTPIERVETRQVQNTTRPSEEAMRKTTEIKALLGIEGLEKGDKAYLSTKNLRTTRPSKKLDHKKEGPFLIIGKPGPATRELQLPKDAKIHLVFNVSLLYSTDPKTPLQTTFHYKTDQENEFEVEAILDRKSQRYLVKWKGYSSSENTWEPAHHLKNCQQLLEAHRRQKNAQGCPGLRGQKETPPARASPKPRPKYRRHPPQLHEENNEHSPRHPAEFAPSEFAC